MFRLALAFGCTVAELQSRMTSQELTEWGAYYQLEPWGTWRDNWHFAQLTKLLYDVNSNTPSKISDFMYEDREAAAIKGAKTLKARLDAMARKQNG